MFFCKYAPLFPICLSWCHLTSLSIAKNSDKFWKKVFWVWFIWSFSSLFLMAIGHTTIQCLYSFWFLIFSAVGVTAEVNCLVLYIVNTLKHKTNKLKMIFSSGFKQWKVPTILIAWHSSLIYYLFPKEEHAYIFKRCWTSLRNHSGDLNCIAMFNLLKFTLCSAIFFVSVSCTSRKATIKVRHIFEFFFEDNLVVSVK